MNSVEEKKASSVEGSVKERSKNHHHREEVKPRRDEKYERSKRDRYDSSSRSRER